MEAHFSTQALKSLFRYPFQGKEWGRKLLYLGLFWLAGYFIPVIPWLFAGGYMAAIIRQAAAGSALTDLPEWQDWNRLLMDGLRMFGAALIFVLPVFLFFTMMLSFYMGGTFAGIALGETDSYILPFLTLLTTTFMMFCGIAVGILLSVLLGVTYSPALTHMVVKGSFGSLFKVREWFAVMRANLGGYLIALFILWGVIFAMQMIYQLLMFSIVLCLLAPVLAFASMPYLSVVSSVLLGQVYKEGEAALAQSEKADEPAI